MSSWDFSVVLEPVYIILGLQCHPGTSQCHSGTVVSSWNLVYVVLVVLECRPGTCSRATLKSQDDTDWFQDEIDWFQDDTEVPGHVILELKIQTCPKSIDFLFR